MSKKANAPKSKPDLGQGIEKPLADLEDALLHGKPVETEQAQPEMAQQALDMLANLEGDLLETGSLTDGELGDDAELWDSLAELEVDLLYDEELEVAAVPAEVVEEVVEPVVVETAVSAPTSAESDLPLADELTELDADLLAAAESSLESVQELEEEILYEPETAVVVEAQALLETEQELLEAEPEEDTLAIADQAELDEVLAFEDDLSELEDSIAAVVEHAFATELETAVDEEIEADEAEDDLAIEVDEWGALADMEAELLTEPASELEPKEAAADELDDLAALETLLLEEEEEGDEVVAAAPAVDSESFIEEIELGEAQILDELIANIDADLTSGTAVETIMDLSPVGSGDDQTWEQYVIFTLAGNKYAVPAANIREVGDINYITPVPNVPDWLLGITNLRGDILSLVHLGAFLGLSKNGNEYLYHNPGEVEMMVVQSEQEATAITTGIVVDEVSDIRDLALERVRVPTAPIKNQLGTYMRGVYEENGQMYILLDLERLLTSPEMWQFEAM
ncbi:MAG: chemotaxis protein CheW [Ardenticatenaceae bacterium]|nr:chemotaxis protein CheW [Ardenticatenaceae bacterium]